MKSLFPSRLLVGLTCVLAAMAGSSPGMAAEPRPTVGTASPSSGSSQIGSVRSIRVTYLDTNGANDIDGVRLLVNTSKAEGSAFCVTYNATQNKLFVIGDNGSTFLGGFAPGTNNVISNSRGSLNCAATTVSKSGNVLTVDWSLIGQTAGIGLKNLYGLSRDTTGLIGGYKVLGTWNITSDASNFAPVVDSVNPSSSFSTTGQTRNIASTYTDANGANNIQGVRLNIGAFNSEPNSFCVTYNAEQNKMYLLANDGVTFLGGFAPGTDRTISNSRGALHIGASSVLKNGDALTVNWSVTPKFGYTGTKNIYGLVRDNGGLSDGYDLIGTWTMNAPSVNSSPAIINVTPPDSSSRANVTRSFTTTYSDPNGAFDLNDVRFLVKDFANEANSLCMVYRIQENRLYLVSDNANLLLGGFPPGSNNTITNSQGSLNCVNTSVSFNGTGITVNWSVTPNNNIAGTQNLFGFARDVSGLLAGYDLLGFWVINSTFAPATEAAKDPSANSF